MKPEEYDVHHRTHLLAKQLGIDGDVVRRLASTRIVLEIGPEAAETELGKLGFLTICNLVTRLGPYVPNLQIAVPPDATALSSPVYRPGATSLAEQAMWLLDAAIPGDGLVRCPADPASRFDVAVTIGSSTIRAEHQLTMGWDGWLASVGDDDPDLNDSSDNPFGAITAAALATARVHALQLIAIGAAIPRPAGRWSLNVLSLDDRPGGPWFSKTGGVLPRCLLVGAGALASSFSYAMTHVPRLRAEVDAVDPDVLKGPNANRQITAMYDKAKNGDTPKVRDLADCWSAINPVALKYDDFKVQYNRTAHDYELAITAVDNGEARRAVANDLPKILIDGATGGLMVAVMRGEDPTRACVGCAYPEVKTDADGIWSHRLGVTREIVGQLRNGTLSFSAEILHRIDEHGTFELNRETKEGLEREGWSFLERARCGSANTDRNLPSASVSYVSALCGFVMAAQAIGEALGAPTLVEPCCWAWDDVLRQAPQTAQRLKGDVSQTCLPRHKLRSKIYKEKWESPWHPCAQV